MINLEYNNGENVVPEGEFRISASGISRFFTGTSSWFKENLTNQGTPFEGNKGSVTGTLVHGMAEAYLTGDELPTETIAKYVQHQDDNLPDLDINYIYQQYPMMWEALRDWLSRNIDNNQVTSEEFMYKELLPGIGVGGSCDMYSQDTVYDFKTYNSKTKPKSMQYGYRIQLLTYAKLLRDKGININYISTINVSAYIDGGISEKTQKPLKSYPSDVTVLTEPITPDDLEMIKNIHEVIAEAVETYIAEPRLRGILAQDNRCKLLPCSYTPFIDREEI
mgnify:FL=1